MDTIINVLKFVLGVIVVGLVLVGIQANFGINGDQIADTAGDAVNETGSGFFTFLNSVFDGGADETPAVG